MSSDAKVTIPFLVQPCAAPVSCEADSWCRWNVLGLLSLAALIAYISRSNIAVALAMHDFCRAFGLCETDRGTVNSAFFWAYAALQLPAGWIVDRYGVKWPYAFGLLFWGVRSAGTSLVTSTEQLIALRILVGIGESVSVPASAKWIRLNFAERRRGLAMGLYMTGTKIGPAVGTPLAAWLIMRHNWRTMFFVVGACGLVWLVPLLFMVTGRNGNRSPTPIKPGIKKKFAFLPLLAPPLRWGNIISA